MSVLLDAVTSNVPIVDPRLSGKIVVCTSVEIPIEICQAMSKVFSAIADELDAENKSFGRGLSISCIFCDTPVFSVQLNPDEIAVCMRLAVYPLSNILPYSGTAKLYMILAEELAHLIWDIKDETLVSLKVWEILLHLFPGMDILEIYSRDIASDAYRRFPDILSSISSRDPRSYLL